MGVRRRANRRGRSGRSKPVKVGDVFERLCVVCDSGERDTSGAILWLCRCQCGNAIKVRGASLKRGEYRSCGCWTKDRMRSSPPAKTHGGSNTLAYRSWAAMKRRCLDPSFKDYHQYGGRGIKIHEGWMDFATFLRDMGERPEGYTLDRKDYTGDYEPANCRWANRLEQGNNTSRNHMLTYKGKTQTMAQWARELDIPYSRLRARLNILKWSTDKALGGGTNSE